MFEKDAEEYYYKKVFAETNPKNETELKEKFLQTFKDGAEFGYNKANEWHYVKDGKYPKECDCCLLYLGDNVNPITGWRHRGVWYFEDDRDLEKWQDKVIAWKEIVLPKEGE